MHYNLTITEKISTNNLNQDNVYETPVLILMDLSHEGVLCASNEFDIDGYEEKLFEW